MKERKSEEDETFAIDVAEEVYLKGREEPVRVNTTFELRKDSINRETPVEDVMGMATSHCLATFDVRAEHRYILSDQRHNKFIFLTDEVQGVSILAPDESTVLEALEA
jgi:1,2-phenylacetyl-CoA epoxidase PaaB subunit